MAIGDQGSTNNEGSKLYENTYYSRLRFKNNNKKALSVSFRSGLLILDISEIKEGFKYESLCTIYLSPTKARMLSLELDKFIEYISSEDNDHSKAFGVNAGMSEKVSYIAFHLNNDDNVVVTIGKIDGSGNVIDSADFEIEKNYNFALEWNDLSSMDLEKVYHDDIELAQIKDLLDDFSRSMSGAAAYSLVDLARYDNARILKKMDPIYDKLGIERKSFGNNSFSRGTNSFLDNSKSSKSNHTSFDNMEEDLFND